VTIPEGDPPHITGNADLTLTGGGFSSPDATRVGEGIVMEVASSFGLTLPVTDVGFSVNAKAAGFELLLGRFYGDFKERGLALTFEGKYVKDTDSVKVSRADISLSDIGTLAVSGKLNDVTASPSFDIDVRLVKLSNREAYELFIKETFQESLPFLSRLAIGGMSSMVISAEGSLEGFNARGEVKVMDADVIEKRGGGVDEGDGGGGGDGSYLSIKGINITLPYDITYPEVYSPEALAGFGSLRVRSFSWGALGFEDLEVFPVIHENGLFFREDITLPAFGGTVGLKDVHYKDILGPGRNLLMSIDVDGIDLSELSVALGMPRFSGSFSGTIPRLSFVGTSLFTEGWVRLNLFGGEMRVSDISIDNVFTPVASLKSVVEFKDIDLGKLTGTFEFGHISGILEGSVKDLVIVNGQPESFEARIETVKRRGVGQKISVEALEKISILGTGSSASILKSGIYRFFKEYKYRKMGFRGSLKNDNFLLLGIETEGDKGYIVRGALLPPKVDVISYTQNISFKEMVKRLKRIKAVGMEEGVRVE
jgi:hypothetical protein